MDSNELPLQLQLRMKAIESLYAVNNHVIRLSDFVNFESELLSLKNKEHIHNLISKITSKQIFVKSDIQ